MEKLSDTEFEILKVIWEQNRVISSEEIYDLLLSNDTEHRWKRRTLSVFITRMLQKGVLTYEKIGRHYYYTAVSKEEYDRFLIHSKIQKETGESLKSLIVQFAGENVTQSNIAEIYKLIMEWDENPREGKKEVSLPYSVNKKDI